MENRINIRFDIRSSLSFIVFATVVIATALFLLKKIDSAVAEIEKLGEFPQYQMLHKERSGGMPAAASSSTTH